LTYKVVGQAEVAPAVIGETVRMQLPKLQPGLMRSWVAEVRLTSALELSEPPEPPLMVVDSGEGVAPL
jgi:hypothetical protein